jgi:predicted transglutaminase-like cysteine proteinase
LAALIFLPATAMAATASIAPPMPLGAVAAPPLGFTELCQRAPTECVDDLRADGTNDPAKTDELAAIRQWAGQARWAALFGRTVDISEAPASAFPGYGARPLAPRPVSNPFPANTFNAPALADEADAKDSAAPSNATTTIVSELNPRELQRINTRINRSIRRADDYATYGRGDYWAAGGDNVKRGDCEDYSLAKRRALIEAGTPGEALSLAIVRTRQGEMHAVLLVATQAGEVVLDNLSPWILPWTEAPYQWLDRQAPGAPTHWVHVEAATRS